MKKTNGSILTIAAFSLVLVATTARAQTCVTLDYNSEYDRTIGWFNNPPGNYIPSETTDLHVGQVNNPNNPSEEGPRQSLMHFDLSSIPSTATVTSATLTVRIDPQMYHVTQVSAEVHNVLVSWDTTATWSSFYPIGDVPGQASYDDSTLGTLVYPAHVYKSSIDVTSLAAQWVSGTLANYGIMFESDDPTFFLASGTFPIVIKRPTLSVCYQ
jgi:hypothetical protein